MTQDFGKPTLPAERHERVSGKFGDREIEDEANEFAMCLLMPADFVRAEIAKLGGIEIDDEVKIEKLAKKFRVGVPVMTLRIGQLMNHKE